MIMMKDPAQKWPQHAASGMAASCAMPSVEVVRKFAKTKEEKGRYVATTDSLEPSAKNSWSVNKENYRC